MLKVYKFDLLLAYILFFPPFIHSMGRSYSIGMVILAVSLFGAFLSSFTSGYAKILTVILLTLLIFHSILAYLQSKFLGFQFDILRFFNYVLAGSSLIITSSVFARSMSKNIKNGIFEKNIFKVFSILAIYTHLVALIRFSAFSPIDFVAYQIPVYFGIFSEPSHIAYVTIVLLFIKFVYSSRSIFLCYLSLAFVYATLIESLVLLVSVGLVAIWVSKGFWKILILAPLFLIGSIFLLRSRSYTRTYGNDLAFGLENANLTGAVFISGWERAYLALMQTDFLGFGLNQFGVAGEQGKYYALITKDLMDEFGQDISRFDGSFIFAKLVGEFGILALIATIGLVLLWYRAMRVLNKRKLLKYEKHTVLLSGFILGYFVLFFLRGTGYVCGATVILMSVIMNKNILFAPIGNKKISLKLFNWEDNKIFTKNI